MSDDATHALHPDLLPMLDCPKWDRCSAPLCPLDREMANRSGRIDARKDGAAREPRCTLPKAERLMLGRDLPTLGLFPMERRGRKSPSASEIENAP